VNYKNPREAKEDNKSKRNTLSIRCLPRRLRPPLLGNSGMEEEDVVGEGFMAAVSEAEVCTLCKVAATVELSALSVPVWDWPTVLRRADVAPELHEVKISELKSKPIIEIQT
jgi:hypothetical protein